MSRLLIGVIVVLVGLLLMTAMSSGTTSQIDGDDTMRLVYYGMWAALAAGGIMASQKNWGEAARNMGLWILIILALSAVYVFRYDAQNFASRLTAGLIPGRAAILTDQNGFKTAVLTMGESGHYEADATIGGATIPMMVDTGATTIALTYEDAERIGLDPANLDFSAMVSTANGLARTAYVTLPEIEIAGIKRTNVRAGVAERGKLFQSLLGMNYLSTLTAFTISGNEMRLQD